MPQSLIFDPDATKDAGRGWWRFFDIGTFLLFVVAAALVFRLCSNGFILGASSGRVELLLRALPFAFLALMLALMCAKPRRYRVVDGETIEGRSRLITSWKKVWWSTPAFWPACLFGTVVLFRMWSESKVGSVDAAVVLLAFVPWLGVTLITGSVLLSESEIRISDEGMRIGLNYFVEWQRIARIVDAGNKLEVIHADYPLPLVAFYGEDSSSVLLRQRASLHNIPIEHGETVALTTFKRQYAVFTLILLLLGLGSYMSLHLEPFGVFFVLFAVSIVLSSRIEKRRGLSKVTRIKPPIDKASLKLKPGQNLSEPVLAPPIPLIPDDTSRR